jgi:glycosyltransferase involved in cell wall biosynthesis
VSSALGQTWSALEVLVNDNASSDETVALATELARRDPRVKIARNDRNEGPVLNWRRCVERARGNYCALLFSDDWYEPSFVARAVELLAPGVGFVLSAVRIVDEARHSSRVEQYFGSVESGPQSTDLYLRGQLTLADFELPVSPGCALMRTHDLKAALETTLPSFTLTRALSHGAGPDLLIGLQLAARYPEVGYLSEPLVNFSWHDANLSHRPEVAAAYELARNDFFDAAHPAAVPRNDHLARRMYFKHRHRHALAALGIQPAVNPWSVNWWSCARHVSTRFWRRALNAVPLADAKRSAR